MAHKLAQGSTRNGRDSKAKFLGVKRSDGQAVKCGEVIVRQRGTKIHPGTSMGVGTDFTLYAMKDGVVKFTKKQVPNFVGVLKLRTYASIV